MALGGGREGRGEIVETGNGRLLVGCGNAAGRQHLIPGLVKYLSDVTETAMYVPERMNDQVSSLDLRGMRGIRQISLPRFEPDQQRRTGIGGAQGVHGEEVAKQL